MMSRLRPRLFLLRGLVVAAVTLAVLVAGAARANDSIEEARVKAAFVLNFIKFTSWPDGQGEATPTLTLCVIGGYALAGQLNALAGRNVQGRQVRLQPLEAQGGDAQCDAVFATMTDAVTLRSLQQLTGRRAALTISDQPGFVAQGGMIELKIVDGRVRFDVNLAAARAANLMLSSQLLQLADRVVQ